MDRKYEFINGQKVDVTTVFDKSVRYTPTTEEIALVKGGCRKHLNDFFPDLLHEETGLDKMFDTNGDFWKANGWLIQAFKKHPNYNGRLQIVIKDAPLRRGINLPDLRDFFRFCGNNLKQEKYYCDLNGNRLTQDEVADLCHRYDLEQATVARLYHRWRKMGNHELANRCAELFTKIKGNRIKVAKHHWTFEKEELAFDKIYRYIRNNGAEAQFLDKEISDEINEIFGDERFSREGSKVSKLIGKIAKRTNLTSIVEIQDASFINQDGELVQRTKDYGWNFQFAKFGDAINPIETKATAVLSLLPVDFYRMSFGHKWASCMTTDKENRRHSENNYHGMYCGGTESYMLDNSTFLLYYLPADWNGTEPEWEDKLKRCNFHLGEDKIVQGRVYPDGRDGGDPTLATDMRNLVQRTIADLFDQPNYWKIEKGTCANGNVTYSEGSHYRDYLEYEDTSVSFWKRIDGYVNTIPFTIGTDSICPECGEYHCYDENIFCEDCAEGRRYRCADCGEWVDEDEVYWVDGEPYCSRCVMYCEDCEEYVRERDITRTIHGRYVCDSCLEDDYTYCSDVDEYVPNDEVVFTKEGNHYYEGSTDMYKQCEECGEYHDTDEMHYDEETDKWYCDRCYEELMADREEERAS